METQPWVLPEQAGIFKAGNNFLSRGFIGVNWFKIPAMEQGWDPEVKNYFRKILSTIGFGLLWLLAVLTFGLYLGFAHHSKLLYIILFYVGLTTSLALLLRYYYKLWK